jgi:hypothetical protein
MVVSIISSVGLFGVIGFGLWSRHERRMTELRLMHQNQGDANLRASVEALQQEMRALRETSTQYDQSFDAALQRMESRVEGLERRVPEGEVNPSANLRAGR